MSYSNSIDISTPTGEQVAWNLSAALLAELQQHLQSANNNYLRGNVIGWFHSLKAVKMRIIQNLNDKSRAEFKKQERLVGAVINLLNKEEKYRKVLFKLVEDYNEYLMDALESAGFLIQKKEDSKHIS